MKKKKKKKKKNVGPVAVIGSPNFISFVFINVENKIK